MSGFNESVREALILFLDTEYGIDGTEMDFNTLVMTAADQYVDSGGSYRQLVAASGVAVSHTGNTNETALATIAIPPLGPNDQIILSGLITYTNSANTKTIRARLSTTSGVTGTAIMGLSLTTTTTQRIIFEVANQGATNSQVCGAPTGSTAATTGMVASGSIETNAGSFLNITGQLTNSGETVALVQYRVEIVRVS